MKKILLLCGVAVMALSSSSCGKGGESSPAGDSIAEAMGQVSGTQFYADINRLTPQMLSQMGISEFNKDEFFAGVKYAMTADTSRAFQIGMQQGMQMASQLAMFREGGMPASADKFLDNFKKALMGDTLTEEQLTVAQSLVQSKQMEARAAIMAKQQAEQERQIKEGEEAANKYMEEQKKADPAIKTSASGLSYKVIKEGQGQPVDSGKVDLTYVGKTIDGKEFDSSRGDTVSFNVDQVVPGFSEGLKMMAPGSKYVLYVPDNLGYNGRGPAGPGGLMIFEVEVIGKTAGK